MQFAICLLCSVILFSPLPTPLFRLFEKKLGSTVLLYFWILQSKFPKKRKFSCTPTSEMWHWCCGLVHSSYYKFTSVLTCSFQILSPSPWSVSGHTLLSGVTSLVSLKLEQSTVFLELSCLSEVSLLMIRLRFCIVGRRINVTLYPSPCNTYL